MSHSEPIWNIRIINNTLEPKMWRINEDKFWKKKYLFVLNYTKWNKTFTLMIRKCQIIFPFTSFIKRKIVVVVNNWFVIKGLQNSHYRINNLIFIKRDQRTIDVLSNNHIGYSFIFHTSITLNKFLLCSCLMFLW